MGILKFVKCKILISHIPELLFSYPKPESFTLNKKKAGKNRLKYYIYSDLFVQT